MAFAGQTMKKGSAKNFIIQHYSGQVMGSSSVLAGMEWELHLILSSLFVLSLKLKCESSSLVTRPSLPRMPWSSEIIV